MEKSQDLKVSQQGGEDLNICKVQFSKEGKWMFVCCGCHVKVFSYGSKQVVYTLTHHTAPVTATTLNPKNELQLFSSSLDGQLALWDYSDGSLLRVVEFETPLYKFGIRPGNHEPSLFLIVMMNNSDMVLVSLPSQVVGERSHEVAVSEQLSDSQQYLQLGTEAPSFSFTYEGSCVVSYRRKNLLVYNLNTDTNYNYRSGHNITAVDCHPSKMCIATGNKLGEIQLWYGFAQQSSKVVTTTLHWHAHSVADICFTTDGTYLLSGGEESVLVLWQLETHKKQFRPRLGSPITKLACSPGDDYFTVSLQTNVVRLVSGLDTEVEYTLGGLRKAYTQNVTENGVKTGLVLCPRSNSLVLNSSPGFLQFYDPTNDTVLDELDVTNLNYVSRPEDVPLALTTVNHAAFSPDGLWLATVEGRDDGKTAAELRMKFWEFSTSHQRYVLNTCVDPPHDQQITSLTFQPNKRHSTSGASGSGSRPVLINAHRVHHMVSTTSMDGKFKTWVLVDDDEEVEKEEKDKESQPSWACRSVGYYHSLPCLGGVFCQDGSLLALNFKKSLTVWDPFTCELLKTFSSPFPDEDIIHVVFGNHSSSQYLMATTAHHLQVWNLLTCNVVWCLETKVDCLVSDPFGHLAAAFVPVNDDSTTIHLYIFDPSSPTPLATLDSVSTKKICSAIFVPPADGRANSTLCFINEDQLLCALKKEGEDDSHSNKENEGYQDEVAPSQKAFLEIFGNGKHTVKHQKTGVGGTSLTLLKTHSSLLSAPPHVLPPMSSICQHFMKTLLPRAHDQSSLEDNTSSVSQDESDDEDSDGDDLNDHHTSSEEDEDNLKGSLSRVVEPMDTDTRGEERVRVEHDEPVGNYDWLVESLKLLRFVMK